MGLLRTIFIIILVYYGFKLIGRFLLPFLAGLLVKKVQKNMHNQYAQTYKTDSKKEGEVTIETGPGNKKSNSHQVDAEDVDFEEIN